MKLFFILMITLPLLSHSYPSAEEKSLSLEETDIDSEHAETAKDSQIQKRSGSFDYVSHLKSGLLSSIGHASASIASGSSGGSSGGGQIDSQKSYGSGHPGNSVEYDPWSLKKSVLNTIFQAVKAITGGVTALKGQLIKGSGYAISASGNLVGATGDKITDVGKGIINSAHVHSQTYPTNHGNGGYVHPFAKFSSLSAGSSGSSSGGSSGGKHPSGSPPVIHTETITTYEIPGGHSNYGPPSKPPTFSSATHQYLPPASVSYSGGGGAPFSTGHAAAFEAPSSNYLPSYGQEVIQDDFNIYGKHKKLTDEEAKKAAGQLQEILSLLPQGKTEFTASKTVTLDTTGSQSNNNNPVNLESYSIPQKLGPLESLSHTESITAAYGSQLQTNPSDIYRYMAKKQSPEEAYLEKHPNESYDYTPPKQQEVQSYDKYNNYHSTGASNSFQELSPIIAALEVAKKLPSPQTTINYSIDKNVHKYIPSPSIQNIPKESFKYLPPVVTKTAPQFFDVRPVPSREIASYHTIHYQKAKRQVPYKRTRVNNNIRFKRKTPLLTSQPYDSVDPIWINSMLTA